MANPIVIDISHYQPTPDWAAVKAGGTIGVILKATEGASYTDPTFSSRWDACKQHGISRSAYHFLRPGDMTGQMRRFVSVVKPSDTERSGQHFAFDGDPFAQGRLKPIGHFLGAIGIHRRRGHHHELVAAKAGDQGQAVGAFLQSVSKNSDEPVTGGMAEVVVDRLEPVEVEEQHRDRPRLSAESRASRCARRARRLCSPVRSSCSAR